MRGARQRSGAINTSTTGARCLHGETGYPNSVPQKGTTHVASDGMADVFATAALDKIAEFRRLRYPLSVLTKCCTFLGASTGVQQWYRVRDAFR